MLSVEVGVSAESDDSTRGGSTENTYSGSAGAVVQAGSITGNVYLTAPEHATSTVTPHELPSAVLGFTDRTTQLAALDRLLTVSAKSPSSGSALIFAVSGTAGVGKTALATHWAHRVHDRFPDGQLYANLRRYDPEQAARTGDVLAGFLRALGVPNSEIPHGLDERAARFRTLVAGSADAARIGQCADGRTDSAVVARDCLLRRAGDKPGYLAGPRGSGGCHQAELGSPATGQGSFAAAQAHR
jgi:hypothetical protein